MKSRSRLLAILAVAASPACSPANGLLGNSTTTTTALTASADSDQADGDVFVVDVTDQGPANAVVHRGEARQGPVSRLDLAPKKIAQSTANVAPPKIRPALRGKSGPLDVIVLLQEDFQHAKLPRLAPNESRDDVSWQAKSAVIQQHIQKAISARAVSQDRVIKLLQGKGATINERHWLVNAFAARIDASQLAELEADPQVKEVAPPVGGELLGTDVISGRSAMNSDPYFNVGLTSGWVAILDSGVRTSHVLLSGQLSWVRDCINGLTNNCSTAGAGLTLDPSDLANHGTAIASVITGTSALGFTMRGTTAIPVDSFRVARADGSVDANAVVRGYAAALVGGDNVVNASLDCGTTVCTDAANNAFDSGIVVVAAVGNSGDSPYNHIAEPASGKRVLGVGGIAPTTWLLGTTYSAVGPSALGTTKPDLLAVGGAAGDLVNLASNASDTAIFTTGGTSLASAFLSGGAALMRRWLTYTGVFVADAGQTNAMLLAAGTNYSSPTSDNANGAGRLSLPTAATIYGGKVTVTSTASADVPISVAAGVTSLDVATWWPEGTTHNDVDLQVLAPDGTLAGNSTSGPSVWEKVHIVTSTPGTWTIRATPYSVTGSQTVYVAAIRR